MSELDSLSNETRDRMAELDELMSSFKITEQQALPSLFQLKSLEVEEEKDCKKERYAYYHEKTILYTGFLRKEATAKKI